MIKFKGQVKFKQYIKNKPVKNGIKMYLCCNPNNGYAFGGIIYTGKDTVDKKDNLTLTDSVILSLTKDYLNSFRILYMDNFFTSTRLSNFLLGKNTGMIGTLRKNRLHSLNKLEFPTLKNEVSYYYDLKNKNKILTLYYDTSKVAFLSNVEVPQDLEKSVEFQKGLNNNNNNNILENNKIVKDNKDWLKASHFIKKEKPAIAKVYIKNAKGVDLCNQKTTHYRFPHKSRKWWKPVFFHLLQITIHNANIVYNSCENKKLNYKNFYISIVKELLGEELKKIEEIVHTVSYLGGNN